MKIEEIFGYDPILEKKFKVVRGEYLGIIKIYCKKQDLNQCLDYVEESAFFPNTIKLFIHSITGYILITRDNFSGRKYIDESKSSMYDDNYPQKWNDKRLVKEIREIIDSP